MQATPNLGLPLYEATDALNVMVPGYNDAMGKLDTALAGVTANPPYKHVANLTVAAADKPANVSGDFQVNVWGIQLVDDYDATDAAMVWITGIADFYPGITDDALAVEVPLTGTVQLEPMEHNGSTTYMTMMGADGIGLRMKSDSVDGINVTSSFSLILTRKVDTVNNDSILFAFPILAKRLYYPTTEV